MLKKPLIFLFLSLAVISCGVGANHQENLERLDKVYGKCDNPHRNYTNDQYFDIFEMDCVANYGNHLTH